MTDIKKYFNASIAAFVLDSIILVLLTEFGVWYIISAAFAFIGGVICKYLLCRNYVFRQRRFKSISLEFSFYFLIALSGLLINQFIMWIFVEFFLVYYLVAKLFSGLFIWISSFYVKKTLLFREPDNVIS